MCPSSTALLTLRRQPRGAGQLQEPVPTQPCCLASWSSSIVLLPKAHSIPPGLRQHLSCCCSFMFCDCGWLPSLFPAPLLLCPHFSLVACNPCPLLPLGTLMHQSPWGCRKLLSLSQSGGSISPAPPYRGPPRRVSCAVPVNMGPLVHVPTTPAPGRLSCDPREDWTPANCRQQAGLHPPRSASHLPFANTQFKFSWRLPWVSG